jgi:hypothetical protein
MFRLGIVGHRYLSNSEAGAFVARESLTILKRARAKHTHIVALSAIAEGADTLFAEAAIALNVPLEIVRPFSDYASDFTTPSARRRYEKLRAAARSEVKLTHKERSDIAYRAAMNWIVGESDLLVVAWNGLPASGPGGTGAAVKQVVRWNRPWFYLNITNLSVTFHARRRGRKGRDDLDVESAQYSRTY